uniref:Uncharacterized protein n=1 Tax=Arion vulgaris TaxID=1028688 RepID=A0A0B7AB34_9EUPU
MYCCDFHHHKYETIKTCSNSHLVIHNSTQTPNDDDAATAVPLHTRHYMISRSQYTRSISS